MGVGGGTAAPGGDLPSLSLSTGRKSVVCFILDVVMGFCFSGSSSTALCPGTLPGRAQPEPSPSHLPWSCGMSRERR